jgi:hypothetical protein
MSTRQSLCRLVVALGSLALPGLGSAAEPAAPSPARPVRVLLAASGPSREYQYVLHLLQRQQEKKQVLLAHYVQPSPGWDEKKIRQAARQDGQRLASFPDHLTALADEPTETQRTNLNSYDLLIAFDLDWLQVPRDTLGLLKKWVESQGGGLVLVAGPIHTHALARPADADRLRPITDLYPLVLGGRWPEGKGVDAHTAKRLSFPNASRSPAFLKLDAAGAGALAGWEDFFREEPVRGKERGELAQGFYSASAVNKVKEGATVLATLSDPNVGEVPYLVTTSAGKGRVVYLGSGELWRLRQYRTAFHERFWKELVRYAAR